jgi:pimeloyl-ACP methyl ester carboxylesterase
VSSIVTTQGLLHYESIGRGQPVILLHGWVNSWDVWRDAMLALANDRGYRVYAIDFWGFGDSEPVTKDATNNFHLESYVEMVQQFMSNLGIRRAPIVGHSMGGTVALKFALGYPERVSQVVVIGAPIVGTYMNPLLKLAGYRWTAEIVWRIPLILEIIRRILLSGDSERVQKMILHDLERATKESYFRSVGDLRSADLRSKLPGLRVPALGIYGRHDNIVSPVNADLLQAALPQAEVVIMNGSRHFPMDDEPERFLQTLGRFVTGSGIQGSSAYAIASKQQDPGYQSA